MVEGADHNPFAAPAAHADVAVPRPVHGSQGLDTASYGRRLAGLLIDWFLYALVAELGDQVYSLTVHEDPRHMGGVWSLFDWPVVASLVGPILLAAYQWYSTAKTGQSIAKRWLGTRVVREGSGMPPGFINGVLLRRWPFLAAMLIPTGGLSFVIVTIVDAVVIFFGGDRQTLHDRVARTIVVKER